MSSYPEHAAVGDRHQQELAASSSSMSEEQQRQQRHPLSIADEEFLNPASCLFQSIVKEEYSTLLQLYAHNARNAIVSYLAMKHHQWGGGAPGGGVGGLGAPGGGMAGSTSSGSGGIGSAAAGIAASLQSGTSSFSFWSCLVFRRCGDFVFAGQQRLSRKWYDSSIDFRLLASFLPFISLFIAVTVIITIVQRPQSQMVTT